MKKSELYILFLKLPIDIAMIVASFVIAYFFRLNLELAPMFSADFSVFDYLLYGLYILPVWILVFALGGLYSGDDGGAFKTFSKIIAYNSTAILFLSSIIFFTKNEFFSRLVLIFIWAISIILVTFGRVLIKSFRDYLYKKGIGVSRVLIVGKGEIASFLSREIRSNISFGKRVVKKISPDVLGDIALLVRDKNIDELIIAGSNLSDELLTDILNISRDNKIKLLVVPSILAFSPLGFSELSIGSTPTLEIQTNPLEGWGRIIKRIFDFIFSIFLILVLAPLFLLLAIIQKITSKGPIFFSHERVGRDGKTFPIYKFRSMYIDKCDFSKEGKKWTTKKDNTERITPFGRFLRKTNLDELPQLVNIFLGQMSFVGPRPELPKFVEEFKRSIPNYYKRHRVKSGLTGWAQVNGLKGDTSIKERVRYDMYYIENWSLWFDLKIILLTISLVLHEAFAGKKEYSSGS